MTLLNPWVWLGFAVALVLAGITGAKIESDHRDAQLLIQERAFHTTYVKRVGELRANADKVSEQLNKADARAASDRRSYEQNLVEAINAKQLSKVDCGGEERSDPIVLINASLWDRALTIGKGSGSDPREADGSAAGASFAPLQEAYANLGENADRWRSCREQVKGWQQLAVDNGWVTGQ